MEGEAARRRISAIAGHFVANEDISAATPIIPMNCSGSLNNKLLFARQGSSSQAYFMRQASPHQGSAAHVAAHMKSKNSCNASGTPIFSRVEQNLPRTASAKPVAKCSNQTLPELPPSFARPNRGMNGQKVLRSNKKLSPFKTNGIEWSPRMDVAESGQGYVLTVEIPGVSSKDIKVEVNERNLTVVGVRSIQSWKLAGFDNDSMPSFHRREILQGPYQVLWPLPNGINKNRISAEFMDGFLQIVVPKL